MPTTSSKVGWNGGAMCPLSCADALVLRLANVAEVLPVVALRNRQVA